MIILYARVGAGYQRCDTATATTLHGDHAIPPTQVVVSVEGFKFENCFSVACAAGEWDGCVGNNSGIMCRQCRDTDQTACLDLPGSSCNVSTLFGVTFNTTFTKSNGSLCEPCDTIGGANTTLIAVATVVGVLLLVGLIVAFFLRRLWWTKVRR